MKIISLVSSFRKEGNTNRIADLMEKQLLAIAQNENTELEIEWIQLGHLDIRTCMGCRVCFDRGEEKCPLKDDLLSVRDKINSADAILAASPVYVEDVNGIMKNWIDRMAFNCHRPAFAGKTAYIVTTSGAGSSNHSINTIKTAFNTWGISVAGSHKFRMGGLMDIGDVVSKHGGRIRKAAEALFKSARGKCAEKPSFYSFVTFKVLQRRWQKAAKYPNTLDYQYWHKNGWLEKNCSYYMPNKANFIKVKFARLIGSIVAVFFI